MNKRRRKKAKVYRASIGHSCTVKLTDNVVRVYRDGELFCAWVDVPRVP